MASARLQLLKHDLTSTHAGQVVRYSTQLMWDPDFGSKINWQLKFIMQPQHPNTPKQTQD
jgi:hypothetical protein